MSKCTSPGPLVNVAWNVALRILSAGPTEVLLHITASNRWSLTRKQACRMMYETIATSTQRPAPLPSNQLTALFESVPCRFMDPLASDSGGTSSGSESDTDGEGDLPRASGAAATARQKPPGTDAPDIDPEALVSGNSVLFVPEPKKDPNDQWDWCSLPRYQPHCAVVCT